MQLTGHSSLTQSNPSAYRQHPPHQPIQRVMVWAEIGASSGTVGGSLWEVPVQEGIHSCQNDPKFPRKIHWRAEVSRDSLSHHELWAPGGDTATKAEGAVLQVRRAPLGTCVPASSANLGGREAGVCPSTMALLHTPLTAGGSVEPGKTEDRSGMCCGAPATYPLPPPSSGQGRSSCASAPTLHTKHTKEVMSQQSL